MLMMTIQKWASMNRLSFLSELIMYLAKRKKYWLIPLIIVFFLLFLIVIISESSAVGSLIYTLF